MIGETQAVRTNRTEGAKKAAKPAYFARGGFAFVPEVCTDLNRGSVHHEADKAGAPEERRRATTESDIFVEELRCPTTATDTSEVVAVRWPSPNGSGTHHECHQAPLAGQLARQDPFSSRMTARRHYPIVPNQVPLE
jgi:hypothetical protein